MSKVDPAQLADAMRFRAEFGIDTSQAGVLSVLGDPTADLRYGTALNADEAAEMDRRAAIQDGIGPLSEWVDKHPDSFGGLRFDQKAGGAVVVSIPRGVSIDRDQLASMAPAEAVIVYEQVDYSSAELASTQAKVEGDLDSLEKRGFTIVQIGVDVIANRVVITVADLNEATRVALESEYGDTVEVREGEAASHLSLQ
ncbi:MAG: hypothetical protein HYX57_03995 [Chloroflexi bacterium]|nr:hypothetical protein [Chloroflexota bacterium]